MGTVSAFSFSVPIQTNFMSEFKPIYEPAPNSQDEIDKFNRRIADITGLSPIGEGFLRVGWGMDIVGFYGGEEQIKYLDPNGKYVGLPYYVLESWDPSEVYNRFEWAQLRFEGGIDVLGPYPHNGVWRLFRICRRDDLSLMPLGDEILAIVQNWKHHATRPQAAQRAVADYKAFQESVRERRERAFEEYRNEMRAELAEELAKPELNAAFTFPTANRSVNVAETKVEAAEEAPQGFKRSPAGLLIPNAL